MEGLDNITASRTGLLNLFTNAKSDEEVQSLFFLRIPTA
jgi:hypothetical protein